MTKLKEKGLTVVKTHLNFILVPAYLVQPETNNFSCLTLYYVVARQGPLPGQVALCRHRTIYP